MVQRGSLPVDPLGRGPRPHELVEVARLELVGVGRQHGEVADAVEARPGGEGVRERQCGEGREPAGTSTADQHPVAVDQAFSGEEIRRGTAILHVDDPPPATEPVAIPPSEPGAAAMVHVDDGEAAARPELHRQPQVRLGHRRRTSVDHHHQRRELSVGCDVVGVHRRVEQPVGPLRAVAGGERHRLAHRQSCELDPELPRWPQHLQLGAGTGAGRRRRAGPRLVAAASRSPGSVRKLAPMNTVESSEATTVGIEDAPRQRVDAPSSGSTTARKSRWSTVDANTTRPSSRNP